MPSPTQINNRRVAAMERIDAAFGTDITHIQERNLEVKIMKQIEAIAEWLESYRTQDTSESGGTIPQHYLDAEQLARDGANKADIVAALLSGDTTPITDEEED